MIDQKTIEMNRFTIAYYPNKANILHEDKVNAFTMGEALQKFHQVRTGVKPITASYKGELDKISPPQTKEYDLWEF